MNDSQQIFYFLGVALAVGLLIGVERGWKARGAEEGDRVAGVRTYGLIGLLGGGAAVLAQHTGPLLAGFMFLGLAAALTAVYVVTQNSEDTDVGITSLVASLVTFVLGALAGVGEVALAGAAAVVTALLLGYKPTLHRWVGALEAKEIRAGLVLLLISVVLLPILPNRGYGPWQALNPYEIWWMVVLIAAISFVGYFAVKLGGARKGALFTGLFGGLASSTALTLHFSRASRGEAAVAPMLATGILLACGTMFPRMFLLVGVLNTQLLQPLLLPGLIMALLVYGPALFYWWSMRHSEITQAASLSNPLELKTAVSFGALLALVMLLGKALQAWLGQTGVLMLAAASGLADVDAITLSLARMSQDDLSISVAVTGILVAAAANGILKGGMATVIGGKQVGLRVGLPLLISALAGLLTVWFLMWR
jgi:uncharacterized membrane protein (DUF4010 family)